MREGECVREGRRRKSDSREGEVSLFRSGTTLSVQEKGEVGVTLKLRGRGVFEKGDAGDVGRGDVLERRRGVFRSPVHRSS